MKTLIFAILFFCAVTGAAYAGGKIDSVYYLLDTTKTPVNDRMWDIHEENPILKFYVINCNCIRYDYEPSFVYDISSTKCEIINKKRLRAIKLVSLSKLIEQAKEFLTDRTQGSRQSFFLIEPAGKKYAIHQVRVLPYKTGKIVDFENVSAPDSTTLRKQ